MKKLIELRSMGVGFDRAAAEIKVNPRTARTWWKQYLDSIEIDIDGKIKERIAQLNKVVEKVLMGFHGNNNDVYAVLAAMDRADRYNGVYAALAQRNQNIQPNNPILEVVVRHVDIETPPENYGEPADLS